MNHTNEYPRIVRAYSREQYQLKIVFKDVRTGMVDPKELVPLKFLEGLQQSGELMRLMIDVVAGTVCWRDCTDFSPVRFYELAQQERC